MGYFRKNPNGGWGHTFLKKTPGIFRFVTLPLEIPDRMMVHPWKFHKLVLHPWEFPRPKTKTDGNSTQFFYHPWKSHFVFEWSLKFPHSFFSIPQEISCPQPSLLHLIHTTACAHARTCATSLMCVKNSMHDFYLWHLLYGTLERIKWKKEQKHQLWSSWSIFFNLC